jgi:succinoglycan biosynthesis protein ExoM
MTENDRPSGATRVPPGGTRVPPGGTRVMVAVGTYRRNEALERLLEALRRNSVGLGDSAQLGVVVVDDNPDGSARSVCDRFVDAFPLGLQYRHVGEGNISRVRNVGLETALPLSDWIAMTDDDCEPVDDWIASYLTAQRATGADALTGPCVLQAPPGAPSWLSEQPFFEDAQFRFPDLAEMNVAATNNSFFRSAFFSERPEIRFDDRLGVVGGEDMVFFRTAHAGGLRIRFSEAAVVIGHESAERATFRHQVRSRFWLGNTEYVTNAHLGEGNRVRWLARAARRLVTAALSPLVRLATGKAPHLRYSVAAGARAVGNAAGALGVRVRHH